MEVFVGPALISKQLGIKAYVYGGSNNLVKRFLGVIR